MNVLSLGVGHAPRASNPISSYSSSGWRVRALLLRTRSLAPWTAAPLDSLLGETGAFPVNESILKRAIIATLKNRKEVFAILELRSSQFI